MSDVLRRSASALAVLFLFFGPALGAAALASALGASAGLVPWITIAVFVGLNYLFFFGGVYQRIDR